MSKYIVEVAIGAVLIAVVAIGVGISVGLLWQADQDKYNEKMSDLEADLRDLSAHQLAAWQWLADHGQLSAFLEWLEETHPPPLNISLHDTSLTPEQVEWLNKWPTLTKRLSPEEAEEEYG